ncbi:hypothetical protein HDV01_000307 [Terramyces sp. JEL0728]|nr:hypothetical protein HDV01_000307 [Terramyces sp. JEL0728]
MHGAYFSDLYLQQLAGHGPTQSIQTLGTSPLSVWPHCPPNHFAKPSGLGNPLLQASMNNLIPGISSYQHLGPYANLYGSGGPMIPHLLDARRDDIIRSEIVYQVANNLRGVRNADNVVRAIAAGRLVTAPEIVKSVLADRMKDEKAARLLKAVATEQKMNHKVDDVVSIMASVDPVREIQLACINDYRRDAANRVLAEEAQSLLTHDLVSQAHLGAFGRVVDGFGTVGQFASGQAHLGNMGQFGHGIGVFGNPMLSAGPWGTGMETIDKYGSALQHILAN